MREANLKDSRQKKKSELNYFANNCKFETSHFSEQWWNIWF